MNRRHARRSLGSRTNRRAMTKLNSSTKDKNVHLRPRARVVLRQRLLEEAK